MRRPSPPPLALLLLASVFALPAAADPDDDPYTTQTAPPPGWRLLANLPTDEWEPVDASGHFAVAFEWGAVWHLEPHGWVRHGIEAIPGLDLGPERRVAPRDALVRSPSEAYVYGTRQTVIAWDGERWQLEHQDLDIWSPRSRFELYACRDTVYAADRWSTKRREPDGRWTSLGRIERPCDGRPGSRFGRSELVSPPDCWRHTHERWNRLAWCRAGLHVWDEAAERWLTHPAERDLDLSILR